MSDKIDIRQLGASAIVRLQEALGVKITYLDALKLWDAITPERRRQVLDAFKLIYDEGNYVILGPHVKATTETNDLAYSDNQRWVTFRYAEGSVPNDIELNPAMKIDFLD